MADDERPGRAAEADELEELEEREPGQDRRQHQRREEHRRQDARAGQAAAGERQRRRRADQRRENDDGAGDLERQPQAAHELGAGEELREPARRHADRRELNERRWVQSEHGDDDERGEQEEQDRAVRGKISEAAERAPASP